MKDLLTINSVQKAFAVLESIAAARGGKTLTEAARELSMTVSSAQRIIHTLLKIGYISKDPLTKKLEIGPKCLSLAFQFLNRSEVREVVYPFLRELNDATDETVNLAVLSGDLEIVYIDRVETSQMITTNIRPGRTRPIYATSIGKAILAFLDEGRRRNILEKVAEVPEFVSSGKTVAMLEEELAAIREKGYSTNLSELDRDLFAVAVPLLDFRGFAVAGINIVVPKSRSSIQEVEERYVPLLLAKGNLISSKLGYASMIRR